MGPISIDPVPTVPEARLRGDKTSRDFEKQSRSASSAIFTLSGVDWGAGVSAAAHSPGIIKGRKSINGGNRPRRPRKQREVQAKKESETRSEMKKRRAVTKEGAEKGDATGLRRRRHSEPRLAPRRTPSKRDQRNRRQSGQSRSSSPAESRRRGFAAASSTALEVSRKETQRSSSMKRASRRGASAERLQAKVDGSLKKSAIRW